MCSAKSTPKGFTRRTFLTGAAAAAVAGTTSLKNITLKFKIIKKIFNGILICRQFINNN